MGANSALQFVDTNVLVYAHDISAGAKHKRAEQLVAQLWQAGNGCLSIQVLQEFYVTVTRKVATPLTCETAAQLVGDLSVWRIHAPNVTDILEAIRIQQRYGLSFWDAMIVCSAAQAGCDVLWSEDLRPGQKYGAVTALNPFV